MVSTILLQDCRVSELEGMVLDDNKTACRRGLIYPI